MTATSAPKEAFFRIGSDPGSGQRAASAAAHTAREQKADGLAVNLRLRGIGVSAVNEMIKCVIILRGIVALNGIDLGTVPAFATITGDDGSEISAVEMRVFELW